MRIINLSEIILFAAKDIDCRMLYFYSESTNFLKEFVIDDMQNFLKTRKSIKNNFKIHDDDNPDF